MKCIAFISHLVVAGAIFCSCHDHDRHRTDGNVPLVKSKIIESPSALEDFITGASELPLPYQLELTGRVDASNYEPVDSITFWTYLEPQESLEKIPEQRPRGYFVIGRITYSTLETGIVYGYQTNDRQVLSIAVFENNQKRVGHLYEFWASHLLNSPHSISISSIDADGTVSLSVWELKPGEKWNKEYQKKNTSRFYKSYFLIQGNYQSLEKPESNQYDG